MFAVQNKRQTNTRSNYTQLMQFLHFCVTSFHKFNRRWIKLIEWLRRWPWFRYLSFLSLFQVNFLIVQILSLVLASIFRTYFHPNRTSTTVRHIFCITFGLLFGYFCFGQQVIHIALLPAICYIVIHVVEPRVVQRWVTCEDVPIINQHKSRSEILMDFWLDFN